MAMATTPISSPPTSISSLYRKGRNNQQQHQQQQQSFPPTSRPLHRYGSTITTPTITPPPHPQRQQQQQQTSPGGLKGEQSPRFRLSKLLAPLQTHHLHHPRSEQDQQQLPQSPLSPQQQLQHHQQAPHHEHRHSHRFFSSKHVSPASRFSRGGFVGFLQSHYHAFHRSLDSQERNAHYGVTHGDKRDNAPTLAEREYLRRRKAMTAVSPRSPEGPSFASNMYSGNSSSNSNSSAGNKSPHTTVHSGYNMTISDFRAHATIASTRSENLPTKVSDVVFERRPSLKNRDDPVAVATPPLTPPPMGIASNSSSTVGSGGGTLSSLVTPQPVLGGEEFKASLRSLSLFGHVTSPFSAAQHSVLSSPPRSPTSSATTPNPPRTDAMSSSPSKSRRMSLSRNREHSSSSPSSSKLKNWASKIAFLNPKRKHTSPLPTHYLSLPVGGTATSPSGMYMLHSEDLSVTEFAKLAGITILQEEDDPTIFEESQIIGNEVYEHRRGSCVDSTARLNPPANLGSEVNTLDSRRNLTVGSTTSGGGSKKTNIWDPQFWSEPMRNGSSNMLLPSASTSSLPITSDPGLITQRPFQGLAGSSAPSSPHLKPLPSLPSSSPLVGEPSSISPCIQTATFITGLESKSCNISSTSSAQDRRNSCAPAVLMPAVGPTVDVFEVDHVRQCAMNDVSLRKADQLSRQPKDTIQLSRDLGRRRSFTSLTAVALKLEGVENGTSENLLDEGATTQEHIPGATVKGGSVSIDPNTAAMTPALHLEPSTPTTPTKEAAIASLLPSMSHKVAMHVLHTPRSRASIPGAGAHSPRSGVSRTRSPSPSPLSRQVDMDSLDSSHEERGSLTHLSPLPPNSRNRISHGDSSSTQPMAKLGSVNKELFVPTTVSSSHHRVQSMPLSFPERRQSFSQQNSTHNPSSHEISTISPLSMAGGSNSTPITPPQSKASISSQNSRSSSPSPGRTFTPGTKVGRFTLVQEQCSRHVDILKAQEQQLQQAQRRSSEGEINRFGNKGPIYRSSVSSLSSDLSVKDGTDWVENPMLKAEDNVRVFQRKRSRRVLDPNLPPPPPVSY